MIRAVPAVATHMREQEPLRQRMVEKRRAPEQAGGLCYPGACGEGNPRYRPGMCVEGSSEPEPPAPRSRRQ